MPESNQSGGGRKGGGPWGPGSGGSQNKSDLEEILKRGQAKTQGGIPGPVVLLLALPKVTQQNIFEIGMRSSGATRNVAGSVSSVREESLMLTGDEARQVWLRHPRRSGADAATAEWPQCFRRSVESPLGYWSAQHD
jgi:hypothetical protein